MALDLRDVTICSIDTANARLAARALHRSMEGCDFADAILFTDTPMSGSFRCVSTPRLGSVAEYSDFLFKRLAARIETPYVLVVQWDGYVCNPAAWNNAFRQYDFIGARWPWITDGMAVGNSGFCLCTRRFLAATAHHRFPLDPDANADWLVCRTYRPALERDFGIRFAPEGIADMFSFENISPDIPSFGFHGLGNMWRFVPDEEMVELIEGLDPYVFRTAHCAMLLHAYVVLGRQGPRSAIYERMKACLGKAGAVSHLEAVLGLVGALMVLTAVDGAMAFSMSSDSGLDVGAQAKSTD